MDLLGDLGTADQLIAARSENVILQAKVKELSAQVKILSIEKASLEAEVEIYRHEAALPNFSKLALQGGASNQPTTMDVESSAAHNHHHHHNHHAFVQSGNGVYCRNPDLVLRQLHGTANPLTVELNSDETVLVSGGADGSLHLVQWGAVSSTSSTSTSASNSTAASGTTAAADVVVVTADSRHACRLTDFASPIIRVAVGRGPNAHLIAAGGMDGRLSLVSYRVGSGGVLTAARLPPAPALQPHQKYIKCVEWSLDGTTLATASADGSIHLYRVQSSSSADHHHHHDRMAMQDDDDEEEEENKAKELCTTVHVTHWQSLHLGGPVECLAFISYTTLVAHARGTAVLSVLDLSSSSNNDDASVDARCAVTELNLNTNHRDAVRGGFDEHVSFCCLDVQVSPCRQFVALATDHDRHIILDWRTKQQIRNLYGHAADGFSSPVIAWSCNGQYLYCNDQHTSALTVYDISTSKIVQSVLQPHTRPIKALWSSRKTNTVVTTSFDRDTVVWFALAE